MIKFLAFLALLFPISVQASETLPSFGLTTGANPRTLCVYDTSASRPCDPMGVVNSTSHIFTSNALVTPEQFGAICDPPSTLAANMHDNTAAITAAIASLTPSAHKQGGRIVLSNCVYKITSTITINSSSIGIEGQGRSSVILCQPTANTTCVAVDNSSGVCCSYFNFVRHLRIASTDVTFTKVGLKLTDISQNQYEDIRIDKWADGTGSSAGYFSGGTGSIGVQTRGRDLTSFEHVMALADKPLVISVNPNNPISADLFSFHNTAWLVNTAFLGGAVINIDDGVCLDHTTFDGFQSWIGGKDGLRWLDTAVSCTSENLLISNVQLEQGTDSTGWFLNIDHTGGDLLSILTVHNFSVYERNGIKVRNVQLPMISGAYFTTASGVGLDIDSTAIVLSLQQNIWLPGAFPATASITGLRSVWGHISSTVNSTVPVAGVFSTTVLKTVATLPTCNSTTVVFGMRYVAGDALAPVSLAPVVGGGAVVVGVICNGVNWIVE